MGRSRRRNRAAAGSGAAQTGSARRAQQQAGTGAAQGGGMLRRLDQPRRVLALYLLGAMGLAVVSLLGNLALVGKLAPWIVLVVVAGGAALLVRWSGARLAEMSLSDEDRLVRLLAGGLVGLAVLFALVAAVALTLS